MDSFDHDTRAGRRLSVLTGHLPAAGGTGDALRGSECGRGMVARSPESFDVAAMNQLLVPHHRELRQRVRDFVRATPEFHHSLVIPTGEYRERTLQKAKLIAEQRFTELSDMRDDPIKHLAVPEELALVDPSLVVKLHGVQWGLFGASILLLGTERHAHLLEGARSLAIPGAFAMTELGHGSNVRGLETTATYDPDKGVFRLKTPHDLAQKYWMGNAAVHAHSAVVFARLLVGGTDYGVHAFLAPLRDPKTLAVVPNVRIADCGHKFGLNGVDNGRIWFDDLEIPRENLLNRFGDVRKDGTYHSTIPNAGKRFFTTLGALVLGRILVATGAVTGTKQALAIAIRFNIKRKQFGDPKSDEELVLLDYPAMQRRLLPPLARTYAYHFAVAKLKSDFQNRTNADADMIEMYANGFKAMASWLMSETQQECREACGGQGYGSINRVSIAKAEGDINLTYEGDNNILLQQVAKTLLQDFQSHFHGYQDILEFMGHNIGKSIREKNPVVKRIRSEEHLLAVEFQQNAFEYREEKAIRQLAKRFMRGNAQKESMFKVWTDSYAEINMAAKAHIERVVLDSFVDVINTCPDPSLVPVLKLLRSLYALDSIGRDLGWFMTNKYLSPVKAKAIGYMTQGVCASIRPHALDLVNAFGFDDDILASPIATNYPDHFNWENRDSHW